MRLTSPAQAVDRGIGYLPRERRTEGLVLFLPVAATGGLFGVPHEIMIAAALLIIGDIVQRRTRFGRYSEAIDAGEAAMRRASGWTVRK